MFVDGSRTLRDWKLNVWDVPVTYIQSKVQSKKSKFAKFDKKHDVIGYLDPWRRKKTRRLEKIAKKNHVNLIYGHSRGGAIVADMRVGPNVQKVGLDAAMVITPNKDMLNLHEDTAFDKIVGATGKYNHVFNNGPRFHQSWN